MELLSELLNKRTAVIMFAVVVMPGLFPMITTDLVAEQSLREQPPTDFAAVTKELEISCAQAREIEETEGAALKSYTSTE
jgi:hypothetical protein